MNTLARMAGSVGVMRLDCIKVPKWCERGDRWPKDLEPSIDRVGLLHPVLVNKEGVLIDGARRLRAMLGLGWVEVPVHIMDVTKAEALRMRIEANTMREPVEQEPSE